ncbi:uncharacterized protein LOC105698114 isoform X2 [Orussus abietinus]|uniref:uncharacterized protein LOC105698114 isoform X2 n=1 Tax=Orussus abietinus TaxID=222816 RepID=UPI000626D0FC|nr:uncharacterized protein LOC105698114 isoform X2 [Orussus abietinus]
MAIGGKHLVLVTDPEIVEDAYAFDNPCFKDPTPAVGRSLERPVSLTPTDTPAKDSTRWSSPWSSLGLGSANRADKRRTLDDSCLGPRATRVSVVSLRSRDFTGLGFNVCGNMREGIFVKDLLHRGPASESGRVHPGDRIASVKISFRSMVYEDALTILSYASPYDVELEVESGGSGSRPATLLKKTVGPSPTRICHPLYRSQSIPELSQARKSGSAKRLFVADPNESLGSSHSTTNSTLRSSKSTPGNQTLERRHDEARNNHHKFGIKVLPALDGTVHRIENQNEHNANLERRHSRKTDMEKRGRNSVAVVETCPVADGKKVTVESLRQRENPGPGLKPKRVLKVEGNELEGIDLPDRPDAGLPETSTGSQESHGETATEVPIEVPSEVPTEVHNAALAARRNRKNSAETPSVQRLIAQESSDPEDPKSPQKNKRKAPAPPRAGSTQSGSSPGRSPVSARGTERDDGVDGIADYSESLEDHENRAREVSDGAEARRQRLENQVDAARGRGSESDTDSEVQNSFTTIELNPADITIHRTPVPEVDDGDDVYRKAASLGDLSRYENKSSATLERAQSLDMTEAGSKKRKAPLPPEDVNESSEDLTRLDQTDTFERRKLKKSDEWGTLEDAVWNKGGEPEEAQSPRVRKKSSGTLERSKSAVEIKPKEEASKTPEDRFNVSDGALETSIELYNLPLSKRLTQEFVHSERAFNPDIDNSLARIVNDGGVVHSPTPEEVELDFRQARPPPDDEDEGIKDDAPVVEERFDKALHFLDSHIPEAPVSSDVKVDLSSAPGDAERMSKKEVSVYAGKTEVLEEPMRKIILDISCPGCEQRSSRHGIGCSKRSDPLKGIIDAERRVVDDAKGSYLSKKRDGDVDSETPRSRMPSSRPEAMTIRSLESEVVVASTPKSEGGSNSSFQTRKTRFETGSPRENLTTSNYPRPPSVENSSYETHFARRIVNASNKENARGGVEGEEEEEEEDDDDGYEFGSGVTVNSKNLSLSSDDRRNVSNVSVSSGENSEDSGVAREPGVATSRQDLESRPPLPSTPMPLSGTPQRMTYVTEIKVSTSREDVHEPDSESEEIIAIMEGNGEPRKPRKDATSNGKPPASKKPPVPPRRTDASRVRDETDRQVVYVSEYKSPGKDSQGESGSAEANKQSVGAVGKKFEQWIFLGDNKEQNPWGNGSSQPQPVTNIVLSSGDERIVRQ